MRMVVMFDLPVETREQRKIATKFRKYLLDEGYVMMQFSVYYRICNGKDMVNKYLLRLEDNVPEKGSVRLITLTEKQFSEMKVLVGGVSPIEPRFPKNYNVVGGTTPKVLYNCDCFFVISPTRTALPGFSNASMTSNSSSNSCIV